MICTSISDGRLTSASVVSSQARWPFWPTATSVGLTPAQEGELRRILQTELDARQALVEKLTAKQISRTTFDAGVEQNVSTAQGQLKALLSR